MGDAVPDPEPQQGADQEGQQDPATPALGHLQHHGQIKEGDGLHQLQGAPEQQIKPQHLDEPGVLDHPAQQAAGGARVALRALAAAG